MFACLGFVIVLFCTVDCFVKTICVTIFRGVTFSLSGPSTKIYHRVHITAMSMEGLCGYIVASTFVMKCGRQLLQKYSSESHGR